MMLIRRLILAAAFCSGTVAIFLILEKRNNILGRRSVSELRLRGITKTGCRWFKRNPAFDA